MSDLPKRLRIKASMIALGERIAWGSDTALMEEAADVIEALSESVENHQLHMLGMARDRDQLRALLTAQSAPAGEREACSECNGLGFGPFGGCGECCGSGQASWQRTQSAGAPESSIYVEFRQCDKCQHGGINDAATGVAACHDCDWTGSEPVEDKCPGCHRENCMAAACPKCGARYVLLASEDIAAPAQPAAQEDYPECDYCGVTPDHHPWHGSGLLGGVESRHIHDCNSCRHLLPASPAQSEKVAHSAQWPTTPGLAAATAQHQRYDQGEVLTEHSGCGRGIQVDQLTVRMYPGDKVVMVRGRIGKALAASTGQEVKP